jgi:hypothetical protein
MIDRIRVQNIFCRSIEFVEDGTKVKSYLSFSDPVLDIRYDRIILRDTYEFCIVEIQGDSKGYVNLRVPKNGIITEVSLITYSFVDFGKSFTGHTSNHFSGVPYFSFNSMIEPGEVHYHLMDCSPQFYKFENALVVTFYKCEIDFLYWIKTDNIYFGLERNELKAVLYEWSEKERHIMEIL